VPHSTDRANDAPPTFGKLLRRYRVAAGLTQEELAERAGLSVRGIADLERGVRRKPYPASLRRLAAGLGLDATKHAALLASTHRDGAGAAGEAVPRMPALPTGTITFLFTDVEGSTRAWLQNPEPMSVALGRHDDLFVGGVSQRSYLEFRSMYVNNRFNCGVYRHHSGWDRSACSRMISVSRRIIFASSGCWSYASALRFWRSFSSSTSTDRIRCTSSFLSKALEWVVGRATRSTVSTADPSTASCPRLVVDHNLFREGVCGFTVECVGACVPPDHLKAQAGEARFQLAGGLLERFGGDLLTARS
jgi:transcriptional regulator with XRE-family HTH domain